MQITGGKFRGLRLRSQPSQQVRPTTRRVREKLFELLAERIEGARFVDLCAGSGAVGLEALSRGASHATFVDRSPRACIFVRTNLQTCRITTEQSLVVASPALKFLRESIERGEGAWDIAYFDPPYAIDYAPVLTLFATGCLLKPRGLFVAEHHCERQPEAAGELVYVGTAELGETCLSFFERKS
ncbi:MAG: rRNA (guanine966-N2)-methyltransferase [Blastocatellia bacterium]|nr:rRNA (guanine966-N2)-methyltransferase [Blastocatellia bacterium]